MRKLIVNSLVTLDGVYGDPRSWAAPYFDDDAAESSLTLLQDSDAMIMGRVTYEYFAAAWPADTGRYADRVNGIRKYVFSSTFAATDEVGFLVFTVLLGNGTALFRPAPAVHLRLRSAHARPSGVVSLRYARAETA